MKWCSKNTRKPDGIDSCPPLNRSGKTDNGRYAQAVGRSRSADLLRMSAAAPASPPLPRALLARAVVVLGLSQIATWGSLYYAIAVLAGPMADDLGLPRSLVFGAFSAALVVSGLASPHVGRAIDRHGGRLSGGGRTPGNTGTQHVITRDPRPHKSGHWVQARPDRPPHSRALRSWRDTWQRRPASGTVRCPWHRHCNARRRRWHRC